MSQTPDWNASAPVQAIPQIPSQSTEPYDPVDQQIDPQIDPQANPQVDPQAVAALAGFPGAGFAPIGSQGTYFDAISGLNLPQGTTLAPVGRRIGAYFLGGLLSIVTLGIGYLIWGAITFSKGQTPAQRMLGLQTWKPQEQVNATWGTMFLRALGWILVGVVPFGQIVSFFLFLTGKEHRALHDSISSTIVLYDPDKLLQPVPDVQSASVV